MKVSFTAKEYARVLELVYYGLHVVGAYQGPDSPGAKRYADIQQKLFELATPMGCADLVAETPDGSLAPSPKLMDDERVEKILSEHTNDAFWHELVARLSDRDASSEQARRLLSTSTPGVDAPPSLEEQVQKIEDGYWAEFEKNDLNNIVLLRGGKG